MKNESIRPREYSVNILWQSNNTELVYANNGRVCFSSVCFNVCPGHMQSPSIIYLKHGYDVCHGKTYVNH